MAASTITRTTWTNDTGTPASPVGDGTLINNARLQDIYAAIDALFSSALTIGGVFSAEGFGTHAFSAGGTGGNVLRVRNTTDGTGNYAGVQVGNDAAADFGLFAAYASSHSSLGDYVSVETSSAASGLWLRALGASGVINFGTGSSGTQRMQIDSAGLVSIASTADGLSGGVRITRVDGSYCILNMDDGGGATAWATLQAGDGSAYRPIKLNPSGSVVLFPDGAVSTPALSFGSDTNTGLYRAGADDLRVSVNGTDAMSVVWASPGVSVRVESGSFGTGAVNGAGLSVGRNNSGNGAAGFLTFNTRTLANVRRVWVDDSGNLRVHTSAPTEDNTTVSDTAGTVVGTQTSLRATKRDIAAFTDTAAALDLVRRTPLYRFRYRQFDPDTEHVGIMADESPEFTRYGGTTFNPVNAFGYLLAAVQQLADEHDALKARLAGARGEA